MGCDIHPHLERREFGDRWSKVDGAAPFDNRSYSAFAFLADVRNYSAVAPIVEPRGLPEDVSSSVAAEYADWDMDAHSASWLTARELIEFDYDQPMNDRRVTRNGNGGVTGSPEEGTVKTYREFLGEWFMREVDELKELGDPERVRVVYWFDN